MEPGSVVAGRYRIVRELGRGGMGAVYVAFDTRFDAEVALKVASASGQAFDEFKTRFEREARIGNLLGQTRGFVRAFDWGKLEDGRTLYMAMDLVENAKDLDLRNGSLAQRVERLQEAANLVQEAHEKGVIHRDLKPENFMRAEEGSLWLGDFGLAKMLDNSVAEMEHSMLTQSGMGMGTPYFMPPEQFENARDVDPRADVYALGAMLFYAITQRYPYQGHSAAEILSKQMTVRFNGAPQPKPSDYVRGVPPGLDLLCTHATRLELQARTPSVSRFLRGVDKFLARGKRAPAVAKRVGVDIPPAVVVDSGVGIADGRLETFPPYQGSSLNPYNQEEVGPQTWSSPPPQGRTPSKKKIEAEGMRVRDVAVPAALAMLTLGGFLFWQGDYASVLFDESRVTSKAEQPVEPEPLRDFTGMSTTELWPIAEQGDPRAMVQLGYTLEGEGMPDEALVWYRKAAIKGESDGMVSAGILYHEGRGVMRDAEIALNYFEQAADKGNDRGKLYLQKLKDIETARALRAKQERHEAFEKEQRQREVDKINRTAQAIEAARAKEEEERRRRYSSRYGRRSSSSRDSEWRSRNDDGSSRNDDGSLRNSKYGSSSNSKYGSSRKSSKYGSSSNSRYGSSKEKSSSYSTRDKRPVYGTRSKSYGDSSNVKKRYGTRYSGTRKKSSDSRYIKGNN